MEGDWTDARLGEQLRRQLLDQAQDLAPELALLRCCRLHTAGALPSSCAREFVDRAEDDLHLIP